MIKKFLFITIVLLINTVFGYSQSNNSIYDLKSGEEFVYGKIGQFNDGSIKYTFAIIRKKNTQKKVYKEEFEPYGPRPILSGRGMTRISTKEWDQYDFWVVFNGEKLGPFDRIRDFRASKSNVDDWVSKDGKKITFTVCKGNRHYIICGNKMGTGYWSFVQDVEVDSQSGKNCYSLFWGNKKYQLYENGIRKLKDWKRISSINYSKDGKDLLYVGAPERRNESFIYLNHQKISESYSMAGTHESTGFIPNTNIPYYRATNRVDGKYKTTIAIGDHKYEFKAGESIGNPQVSDDWLVFYCSKPDKSYYFNKSIKVFEYNVKTGEMTSHGNYSYMVQTRKLANKFYYITKDKAGNSLLVGMGGKVIENLKGIQNVFNITKLNIKGETFTYYKKSNKYGSQTYFRKNGKALIILPGKKKYVLNCNYNSYSNKLELELGLDAPVGAKDVQIMYGSNSFNIKKRVEKNYYAYESDDVYSIIREKNNQNQTYYTLYKNGKPISEKKWIGINEFKISNKGNRYALLSIVKDLRIGGAYTTQNKYLNLKRDLFIDGVKINGNYGSPIWNSVSNCFLSIKEENGTLRIVKL